MQQQNKLKFSNIFRAIFFNKKSMNTILDYSFYWKMITKQKPLGML